MDALRTAILSALDDENAKILINKEEHHCHFDVIVVSDRLKNLNRLQRHRLILNSVKKELEGPLHALSIKAYTIEEWSTHNG